MREIMGQLKLTVNEEKTRSLQGTGRAVRLSGLHVWADVFDAHGAGSSWLPAVEEQYPAHGEKDPCADR